MIETALTQMETWQAAGLDLPVSVNVSARQLRQVDFFERLCARLAAHPQIKPSRLELEVLETSVLEDLARVSQVIEACGKIGVRFVLDNFGVGYTSLTYLKRLPVKALKIDQSFVHDMLVDPENLDILVGMLGLADAFHLQVIAQGVETVSYTHLDVYKRQKADRASGPKCAEEAYALFQQFQPDGVIAADDDAQAMFVAPFLKDKTDKPVMFNGVNTEPDPVSYTHLDVYKRQGQGPAGGPLSPRRERGPGARQPQHPQARCPLSGVRAGSGPVADRPAGEPSHPQARQLAEHRRDRTGRLAPAIPGAPHPRDTLTREVAAWEQARTADPRPVNWRFTTPDSRIKLKRLYPSIQNG